MSLQLQRPDFSLAIDTALPATGISAICGPSGSGKTSLLRCIAGLEANVESLVQFCGQDWNGRKNSLPCEQRGVAVVFQDAQLFPHLSVAGNLHYAQKRQFQREGPTLAQVCEWLQISSLLNRSVAKLSGGERKRVAIARALLRHPQLLLMDEPLTGLHDSARDSLMGIIERLPAQLNIPIIYVSHSFQEISRLADHLLYIDEGRIVAEGDLIALSSRADLALGKFNNAGAVLTATLNSQDEKYQLSELGLDAGHRLLVSAVNSEPGQALRIHIPAKDVSICLTPPEHSSILNILGCTIDDIHSDSAVQNTLRLKIGEQYLLAQITKKSCDHLRLQIGQDVFAQIKSVALLREGS